MVRRGNSAYRSAHMRIALNVCARSAILFVRSLRANEDRFIKNLIRLRDCILLRSNKNHSSMNSYSGPLKSINGSLLGFTIEECRKFWALQFEKKDNKK